MTRHFLRLLRPTVYVAAAAAAGTQLRRSFDTDAFHREDIRRPLANLRDRLSLASVGAVHAAGPAPAQKRQGRHYREQRFLDFASVEFDSVPYMTPQDFLESVTQDKPRFRKRRRVYSRAELSQILYKTPSRWWASNKLFRSMGDQGIISYSEYLFLLCILAKPRSGFEIAFKMIDLARNQRVDKTEFTILNKMMLRQPGELKAIDYSDVTSIQDTTLILHFFGKSGADKMNFKEFSKFMTNLQNEVLEIEFTEFSKGLQTISESEFAKVLLRYTNLSYDDQEEYVQKIKDKLVREEGIKFQDFLLFFQFLNNLDDFTTALKMYALAGHSISQEEFQRAVKACVGYTLAPHLVSTVFLLFDKDDDGNLSFQEFLSILRDRMRGLSSRPLNADTPIDRFRRCVTQQMKDDAQ